MKRTAFTTATVANLGPGFDVLGLCLDGPGDRVTAELIPGGEVEIAEITGDGALLSREATKNCIGVVARHLLNRYADPSTGVRLWLDKGLPLGSGLGSSAASSVAAGVAVLACLDINMPRDFVFDSVREGERLATGSPHPDNVAPALFGGAVACLHGIGEHVDVVTLPVPDRLFVVCVKPAFSLSTEVARAALPRDIPMADAIRNIGAVAGLVKALMSNDLNLLGRCLEDRLATPYRKGLIPGYDAVVASALAAGALGAGISGAGPSIFALTDGRDAAMEAADRMVDAFESAGHASTAIVCGVNHRGAEIIE